MTSPVILAEIYKDATVENCAKYADHIAAACKEFGIDTDKRIAGFLAQVGHESGQLNYVRENLNYKAESLLKVFPKYFPTLAVAKLYERNPEKIANKIYANRMGNGDEASGDGFRYRGRGLIQITGKFNYSTCGLALGNTDPAYLETAEGASRSAAWFWKTRGLNAAADAGDIIRMTRLINGGTIGLEDREHLYKLALEVLEG